MLYKNTLVKIKKSFGRYISLLIIVLVGVGFYAGIQASAPDFIKVADDYYHDYNLMDFKIVSTMGLTKEDVAALKSVKNVNMAIGSYSLDVIDKDKTIRVHAIEELVNQPRLIKGQMPKDNTECLADSKNYQIGDKITITSDVEEELKNQEFTVTGLVDSVLYIADDYGSTTVGDGKLASFIFIDKDNFTMDAYSEVYLTMNEIEDIVGYSDAYKNLSKAMNDQLINIKSKREDARYEEIYKEAHEEITKNKNKLKKEKRKGEKKLKEVKLELDDNKKKLAEGEAELEKNEINLNNEVKKRSVEFETGKAQIREGYKEIDAALKTSGIKKEELPLKVTQMEQGMGDMKEQLFILPPDSPEYAELSARITKYSIQYEGLVKLKKSLDTLSIKETQLKEGSKTFYSEINKGRAEIKKGKLNIAENEKKLKDGYDEYNRNLKKFNKEIKDGEEKIAEGEDELAKIEHPQWVFFDREASVGYKELDDDIDVVASIAGIFPIFFMAIVALMSSNTMARMIAEERSELGTLASLGYQDRKIIGTYLLYVLSATGFGGVLGYFIGCRIFPPLIFENYNCILPPLVIRYDIVTLAGIMLVSMALMAIVTIVACNKELKQKPATLLRPLPPKHGQKIFLERIGVIWNHLSFIWKVTMRNMFRYKKRALMIIVGVAGCTSFMVTGFGLRDSMDGIVDKQYQDIFTYDNMIVLKDEVSTLEGELEELFAKELENPFLIHQIAMKCEQDDKSLESFLIVPEDTDSDFLKHYHLTSKSDNKPIKINSDGVVVTQKIANVFKVGKGDTIKVKDIDNNIFEFTITDVAENYISNYIYMDNVLYAKIFEKPVKFNGVVSNFTGDEKALSKRLIDSNLILNTTFTSDIMEKALEGNARLNSIIVLLVVVASLLAIIVLYNLTSINISERKREIATLKVLGFRDGETNAYIYREALILTVVSILIGLGLGIVLHRFVLDVIEGTTRTFFREIKVFSFLISAVLTMVFSLIMQVVTYFKLKTVDMIESLKSVE